VQYKDKPKVSHAAQRSSTYRLLQQHAAAWLGHGYTLGDPPESLVATDHAFDAWLSAVTAFAHTEGMTITWPCAEISEEEVNTEGHILILGQTATTAGAAPGSQEEVARA
jgi:hypothetical protein